MRVTNSLIYNVNVSLLNKQQAKVFYTQQQISTGQRMLTAADDPAAAARALEVTQSQSMNTRFANNLVPLKNTLTMEDGVLGNISTLLQDMKGVVAGAGNAAQTDAERKAIAQQVQGNLQQLLGLANSTDGAGTYMFSGSQGSTIPFAMTSTGAQYQGDNGQRLVQASVSRQISTSDNGYDLFMRAKNGNGTFQVQPTATNTGSGVATQGGVINSSLLTGNNYQVAFSVAGGATTYTVTDVTTGTQVVPATAYVSGQSITFDGMQFSIKGTPVNGDTFNVSPSKAQDIFTTLTNLVNALNTPVTNGSAASGAALQQALIDAGTGIDNALNQVLSVRASVGARLSEVDTLQTMNDALSLQYTTELSQLRDLDYNKAITDLTSQTTALTAAQKAYSQISNLSMFQYM